MKGAISTGARSVLRMRTSGHVIDRLASDRRRARLWRGLEIAVVTLGMVVVAASVLTLVLPGVLP